MARPKKKPDLKVVGKDGAGIGHNSALTDEQMQALHLNNHVPAYERALKAKKDADASFKNVCKTIKAEGGSIASVKRTIDLRTPEGEARLKADIEELIRNARWNGLPVGTQGDMFGPDRRPVEERALEDGKRIGMSGGDCKPPHQAGTSAYDKWIEGWHAGQAILAGGFKQKEPDAPELLRPEGNEPAGSDDFDAAADGASGGGFAQDPGVEDADGAPWPDEEQIAAREPADAL